MFVGIGGNTGQYEKIVEICERYNLKLILDAAHMAGTKLYNEHVGKDSDVSIYSFQAVKNLPSADSGMICFKDKELDKLVRQLSWLGISKDTYQRFNSNEKSYKWYYDIPNLGYKYHGNSIVASIAMVELKYLDEGNKHRNEICKKYENAFRANKNISIVPIALGCISSRHLFQIRVNNRDEIIQYLHDKQIYPGVHYIDNTQYDMYDYAQGTCPEAHKASAEVISLPVHLNLTVTDLDKIIEEVNKAIAQIG